MNPIEAKMLSHAFEADLRRDVERRRRRQSITSEPGDEPKPKSRLGLRFPRFGIAGSKG